MIMKKFYNKYANVIVICLLFLLFCKSCQSCYRANQIEWNEIKYEQTIDSVNNIIDHQNYIIDSLVSQLNIYKEKIQSLEVQNDILNELNKNQIATNKALINTNNNLNRKINN